MTFFQSCIIMNLPHCPVHRIVIYHVLIIYIKYKVKSLEMYQQEEQNTVPLATLLDVVNTQRCFGNRCFGQGRFEDAKDRYKQVSKMKDGFPLAC